jgi:alkaline phosphatase
MSRIVIGWLKVCLLAAVALAAAVGFAAPKYVFLFIGDGMAAPQRQLAEAYALKSGYGPLAMNALPHKALTGTKSAKNRTTDSAAAATAIACGEKTYNDMLGVLPGGTNLQSVAEVARASGRKVGILTTVGIWHATPAGFYAHRPSRSRIYEIGLDLVASGYDYFAGGGFDGKSNDKKSKAYRGDILELARAAGYAVATKPEEWRALKPGTKALYAERRGFYYMIDGSRTRPTLSAMLAKGIELIDNEKGFFIMCEGGEIDHAAHANDAATVVLDVLELDRAVKIALDFQRKHPDETLILVTGDHETGGLVLGGDDGKKPLRAELLGLQKKSARKYSKHLRRWIRRAGGHLTLKEIEADLFENFGFVFPDAPAPEKGLFVRLTPAEMARLEKALAKDVELVRARRKETTNYMARRSYVFAMEAKKILNARAGVAWKTGSHTALPTLTTASGAGAEIVDTMTENTDISRRLKDLLKQPLSSR